MYVECMLSVCCVYVVCMLCVCCVCVVCKLCVNVECRFEWCTCMNKVMDMMGNILL